MIAATRRLAAILAADVAGYSRLMGADEEGTLERLKARCAMSSSIRRSPSTRADTALGGIEDEDAVDIAPPAERMLAPFDRPVLEGGEQTPNASDFLWTPSVYNASTDECREGGFSRDLEAEPPAVTRCGSGKSSLLPPSERGSAGLAFDS